MSAPQPQTFQALSADDPCEVGGYRLIARLGTGGMGRVYLSHTPGGRPIALKVVRPELAEDAEFRRRFAQEVANAQRIHGLYTAQVVDSGADAATPWLATAYVSGPSLQQVVHQHGPLPERTVLLLMAGIAEALQVIHSAGVVHRDLKPANVLIAADGPRVIDFGIARAADASALTGTGLQIGSPGFMAPEQAMGTTATPATDIFALGALAVYISGGTPPFGNGPASTSLYRAVHEEPDLTRVPTSLHALLRHCLAKQPEHRPSTAQVIEAARNHPAVAGQFLFTEDWLPQQVSTEIARRSELPTSPAAPPTVLDDMPAVADARTVLASHPAPAGTPEATPDRRNGSRRKSLRRTALTAAAALLIGAGGAFALLDPGGTGKPAATDSTDAPADPAPADSATASDSDPATVPGYTEVYTEAELTSPDHTYEFDIKTGKVLPEGTAPWYLGRSATEFSVPEENDAYIAQSDQLALADCIKGIESQPVTQLPFSALPSGRSFCVRAQANHDIAIVRVISTTTDDGPVKVSMDYYRAGD
ncbi:serine/threonine-protein kinase [Kitasatospora sp. GP82]|uniref:serine/threonine-protein kinase n=1 Tax=Kitasatospora sp. GP82 TaxID=3035089 RepID=UPI002475228F|nr:serine/threonine-protein kinase [Kitasatospora sp. GP82]MDH6124846.1 serine/threonine protein kinase [Kitasatospora sp. GP82]